jgi:ferrochelatase
MSHDAFLLLSFGGPEGPDDVMPFLDNVLRGRNVPEARKLQVAEHYHHFGGRSPINDQNRALLAALEADFRAHGIALPLYWGNRNWHPLLKDTLQQMQRDGVRRALAFVTSAFPSYSGCRQYLEDVEKARAELGPDAPQVEKLRPFSNHPGFLAASADRVREALARLPETARESARLVFTAHSIPLPLARECDYEALLRESCGLVAEAVGRSAWDLVWQSRSGPPGQPWLEPDILDHLTALHGRGVRDVVAVPIGFVSDHMEVVYDLDTEAQARARELGLHLERAATAGTHPAFVGMIRELVLERTAAGERRALGSRGPSPDVCPEGCCPYVGRPAGRPSARP